MTTSDLYPAPARNRRLMPFGAAAAFLMLSGTAFAAQPVERIVAVVNDQAISEGDLNARMRLVMLAGKYPDDAETREQLQPQVLRSLIDDQLRLQEARRLEIKIEPEEINAGVEDIAKTNNQTLEDFEKSLAKDGIQIATLQRQTAAQLAWNKVIQKELRRRVDLSQEEVDAAYARLMTDIDKPQYLLAEIYLSVDKPSEDQRIREFAEQLVQQIKQGAQFVRMAQQFSQAAGAAQGGDLGWVHEGELGDEIDQVIRRMVPGQITDPIRTQTGYHILYLREKGHMLAGDPADSMVHLKNVLIPYTAPPTKDSLPKMIAAAEKVRASLPNCAAIDARRDDGLSGDLGRPGEMMRVGDLQRGLAQIVAPLQVDQMSPPIPIEDGIMLFMVCQRKDPPRKAPPTKEQIENQLYMERLDLQQQRYLSNLRSAAFIDVRV